MSEQQQHHTRETARERDARIFPVAVGLNRKRQSSGGEQPTDDDVKSLVEAWRDPKDLYRLEVNASARQILVDKWPSMKEREGRAKWDDYEQLSLFGKEWKSIGTRAYQIELPDGSLAHRCLFEMNEKQRKQARATLSKQRSEAWERMKDIDKFGRLLARYHVPASRAPSDFFTARPRAA